MQFGCLALDEIIQVSDQPVAPSLGFVNWTGLPPPGAFRTFAWYCQAVPIAMSPLVKPSISSWAVPQYLPMSDFCWTSRSFAAASWVASRAYGLVILRSGLVAIRYIAASAT